MTISASFGKANSKALTLRLFKMNAEESAIVPHWSDYMHYCHSIRGLTERTAKAENGLINSRVVQVDISSATIIAERHEFNGF